jgi:hypothetical protein
MNRFYSYNIKHNTHNMPYFLEIKDIDNEEIDDNKKGEIDDIKKEKIISYTEKDKKIKYIEKINLQTYIKEYHKKNKNNNNKIITVKMHDELTDEEKKRKIKILSPYDKTNAKYSKKEYKKISNLKDEHHYIYYDDELIFGIDITHYHHMEQIMLCNNKYYVVMFSRYISIYDLINQNVIYFLDDEGSNNRDNNEDGDEDEDEDEDDGDTIGYSESIDIKQLNNNTHVSFVGMNDKGDEKCVNIYLF